MTPAPHTPARHGNTKATSAQCPVCRLRLRAMGYGTCSECAAGLAADENDHRLTAGPCVSDLIKCMSAEEVRMFVAIGGNPMRVYSAKREILRRRPSRAARASRASRAA